MIKAGKLTCTQTARKQQAHLINRLGKVSTFDQEKKWKWCEPSRVTKRAHLSAVRAASVQRQVPGVVFLTSLFAVVYTTASFPLRNKCLAR